MCPYKLWIHKYVYAYLSIIHEERTMLPYASTTDNLRSQEWLDDMIYIEFSKIRDGSYPLIRVCSSNIHLQLGSDVSNSGIQFRKKDMGAGEIA